MDSEYSSLTQQQLSAICNKYHIGSEFATKVPDRNEPVNQPPPGMAGVYAAHFEVGNLRLPLRPFFKQILDHYRMHICQLTPTSVLKIVSFDMLCNALNISPTIPLFQNFFYLSPVDVGWFTLNSSHQRSRSLMKPYKKISGWRKKFFFVDIQHDMDMRASSAIDPGKGSFDANDAKLLSCYTFRIEPFPQDMLSFDVKAARLLMSSQYIEKKSMEVMEETERNVEEEEEKRPLIDEDSAGLMNVVRYPSESNSNCEIPDYVDLISFGPLEIDERIEQEQGLQTHLIDDDSAGLVHHPCNETNSETQDYVDLMSFKPLEIDERIEQEQGLQTHLIDDDSAGLVHQPCNQTNSETQEILESLKLELELLGNNVEDPCDKRIEQGVETHLKYLQSVLCGEHPCEPENDVLKNESLQIIRNDIPSRRNKEVEVTVKKEQGGGGNLEDLAREFNLLTKEKNDLQDECLHRKCSLKEEKEKYDRKLSEVMALKHELKLESIAHRANLKEPEANKQYFLHKIVTLKQQHKKIVDLCNNFVTEIQEDMILFERKELKEKLHILCDAFKASEGKWKAGEEERLRLAQDRSWLINEGISLVTKRLMKSQEFCEGLSPIITAAVKLGIAEGKLLIDDQSSHVDELQYNVKQAAEMIEKTLLIFQELKWSYLEALANQSSLEDLKNTIPKQTPADGKEFIEHLCDQLSCDALLS